MMTELLQHLTCNQKVVGSNPTSAPYMGTVAQSVENRNYSGRFSRQYKVSKVCRSEVGDTSLSNLCIAGSIPASARLLHCGQVVRQKN